MDGNFWERVLDLLDRQDIPRKEFAAQVGISYSSIHNGVALGSVPSADIALKIAERLDVPIEYLVFGNDGGKKISAATASKKEEQFLYRKNKDIISAIEKLSPDLRSSLRDLIVKIAKNYPCFFAFPVIYLIQGGGL